MRIHCLATEISFFLYKQPSCITQRVCCANSAQQTRKCDLSFGRIGVVTVRITGLNFTVHTMDDKFRSLIATDNTTSGNRFLLGGEMSARTLSAAALHIPPPLGLCTT